MKGIAVTSLLFILTFIASTGASSSSVTYLATFDNAKSTTFKWKDVNDPVMGGKSSSTWEIDASKSKSASWNGEVRIVPSLKAPGFCNAETDSWFAKFNDCSATSHLLIHAKSNTPSYRGFKVSFAADTLNVQFHSFKAPFNMTSSDTYQTVAIPFTDFSNDWSAYTGRCDTKDPTGKQHVCCSSEHPEVCPTKKNLKDISEVGLWTEGVAGKFNLDIMWIGCGNPEEFETEGESRDTCQGSVESELKYNVSNRLAEDYLPDGATPKESLAHAVCCDSYFKPFAEPAFFFSRPDVDLFGAIKKTGKKTTIFYDSVCGLPLFEAPKNRTFEEFQTESNKYHWPSFRKDEIIGDNVKILKTGELVSKCGTHLGSNQPDELGDRFCTDLVCLSGHPKSIETTIARKATNDKAIATFDGAEGTTWPFVTVNDPVMGGQSNSTITIKNKLAYWSGEVKIVPFLHAPGFCTIQSPGLNKKEDVPSLVGFDGIVVKAMSRNSAITLFRVTLESSGATHDFKRGQYTANFALKSDTKDFLESYVPWTAFKCSWRGEKVDWCPDITTQLDKFNMIGISTAFPGKAGKFNLEVESISARKF